MQCQLPNRVARAKESQCEVQKKDVHMPLLPEKNPNTCQNQEKKPVVMTMHCRLHTPFEEQQNEWRERRNMSFGPENEHTFCILADDAL